MQIYKFGGASVKDAAAVKNVVSILEKNNFNEKVVVISAMGKCTNELENVVRLYYANETTWEMPWTIYCKSISTLFMNCMARRIRQRPWLTSSRFSERQRSS